MDGQHQTAPRQCSAIRYITFKKLGQVRRLAWQLGFSTCLTLPVAAAESGKFSLDAAGLAGVVQPFLKEHCVGCHGPEKVKGDFRIDTQLGENLLDPGQRERWASVVDVLNSHEMPPEKEPQPAAANVAAVVDWITAQMVRAEDAQRDGQRVLRRLNRTEYANTIRALLGVEADLSAFPLDGAAGGFDNNGKALTMSPMLVELYLEAARKAWDQALVEGPAPALTTWRFQPEEGSGDDHRVRLDAQNTPIVHGGKNEKRAGFTIMHHESWDRHCDARDFAVPLAGNYVVRVRAAGRVPTRADIVSAARQALEQRCAENKDAKGAAWQRAHLEEDLAHFQQDPLYDYGPPRLKLIQNLGGQPKVVAEWDVAAPTDAPQSYEFTVPFTTQRAGLSLEYAYSIPKVLENSWMQTRDTFPRPEAWVDWYELSGPIHAGWPPAAQQELLPHSPLAAHEEAAEAAAVLAKFLPRAYRRPVSAGEMAASLALYTAARPTAPNFLAALKVPLTACLAAPSFLYLTEPTNSTFTAYELATRLAYFLWSAPPDAALTAAAAAGELADPAKLRAQADRLLADPRAEALAENFAAQWLGLREVGANPPAAELYPNYDRHAETSMVQEALAFFNEVRRQDLSVLNFVSADFAMLNERMARYYGIPGVRGDAFRRVTLPPESHRGGLLTQAAMLCITSNGTRTSPVKRGVWVLKNVLGTDPGLPVSNAGDIAPKVPGLDKATVRQRLEIHRTLDQCARCHNKIDPLGLALENFNASGAWRQQEGFGYQGRVEKNDPLIDAHATLPDGTAINGVAELQAALVKKPELFLRCLAGKLYTYALGRELRLADRPTVLAACTAMTAHGHTLRSLIHFLITTPAFTQR